MAIFSDEAFKDVFEKQGAVATADAPELPQYHEPASGEIPPLPDSGKPKPRPRTTTMSDAAFGDIFSKKAPAAEGVTGARQGYDPQEFNFQPKLGQNNEMLRAQQQGWLPQVGKTIGNTVANIPIDLLQAVSQTGELFNSDHSYDDLGESALEKIKNPFGEVYREHPDKTFDLADPAWWLNNAGGFIEGSAQFLVPGEAEAAGVGGAVKALSTAFKLGKGASEALTIAGQGLSATHIAYLMAASSGRQVYKDSYDTNYHRLVDQGYDPYSADEQAKEISSKAAAATVQLSTGLNAVFGMAALTPLFRNGDNKIMNWLSKEGSRQEGESLSAWKERLSTAGVTDKQLQQALKERPGGIMSGYPAQALQIGIQGVNTEYAEKTGREIAAGKTKQNIDAIADYFDKVTDQEGALNFLTGLIGGPVHALLMDNAPIHKVAQYDDTGKPLIRKDAAGETLPDKRGNPQYVTQRVSARTQNELGNQVFFDSMRDAISKDVDWYSGKQNDLSAVVKKGDNLKAEMIRQEMYNVLNLHAVSMGMGDNWKKEYQGISSLDNTKDLGQQLQPQIDQLTQQIDEAKIQQQDTAPLEGQLQQLTAQQQQMQGKTEASVAGFSRGIGDNDYKDKAARAISNLDWLKKSYDDLRTRYVSMTNPNSEELAYHVFAREAELHLMRQTLDDEKGSISRDQQIVDPIQTYNEQAKVADATARSLNEDKERMQELLGNNDLDGLRALAGKYRVPSYGDHMILKGVQETVEKMQAEIDRHNADSKAALDALHADTGFTKWQEKNDRKEFSDYLEHIGRSQPVDDRIAERQQHLAGMESQYEIRKQNLEEIKSSRGIEEFYKNARKDMDSWKKATEEKNARDSTNTFLRQQDMVASERLRRQSLLGEQGKLQQEVLRGINRENELKTHITGLRGKLAGMKATDGEKILAHRSQLQRAELELHQLQQTRLTNNDKIAQLNDDIQQSHRKEETAASLTRDQVQNQTDPEVGPPDQPEPSVAVPSAAPAPPASAGHSQPAGEQDAVKSYLALRDQLSGMGSIGQAVSNLELMQDPANYSFDLTRAALEPFIQDGTINEDLAHEIMLSQQSYLGSNQEQIDQFNAIKDGQPLIPTPLPEEMPAPTPELTPEDVTGPEEAFSPVMNLSPEQVVTPEESQKIDKHLGAKAMDSMKINTAAIQYMEAVKTAKDGRKYHVFLPMYDKLDDHFNSNILKPGFINEGDSIRFEVDTAWKGGINYDHAMEVNDYGGSVKRRDEFANYMEDGRIRMQGEGYSYQNVPIRIVHEKSGELVGYLPRTDWVTASYAEGSYRNMVDQYTDAQGNEITGNVEAQKEKLLTVRRMISLAHNQGQEEPIRSTVSPRDSGGHPFFSTEVNRNTESSKLKPKLGKNLLPDPSLRFGIMNGGTVYTGHNTPLEGQKNFTPEDLARIGKGKEANNVPMVILPMPNGRSSVSPLYTRQLSERPADIHTIARVIEAHLGLNRTGLDPKLKEQYARWQQKISDATGAGGKPLDISNPRHLESFINQYYTYTQHFREADMAMNARVMPDKTKTPRFMLDIEHDGIGSAMPNIKIGTSWSGEKPIMATLGADGHLDPRFEEALTDGLGTHYKNVVFSRGDIRGVNDDKPFHAVTIQRNGVARTDKHDNYNEYLKSFAETYVYGKHQADDGTYLYGANPITNFSYDDILTNGIRKEGKEVAEDLTRQEDNIFDTLINGAPNPGDPNLNNPSDPKPPVMKGLQDILTPDKKLGLTVESITGAVSSLYDEASANPDQRFHLELPGDPKAKIKLGDKSTITMTQLASIVDSRPIPYNIHLSDDFMSILQNTPRRFLNNLLYEDHSLYEPLPYDEKILGRQIADMFVPARDVDGEQTGVFEAEKQSEVTDNIVQSIKVLMDSGKATGLSVEGYRDRVKNDVFRMMRDRYDQIAGGATIKGMEAITPEQATNLRNEYDKVLRSFDTGGLNFWSLAIDKLKALGINTRETRGKDDNKEQMHLTADGTDPLSEATFNEAAGHGLRDWSDVSFETDPKDTATARMKMFLATVPDSRVGDEEQPRDVKLSFTDPKVRAKIVQETKTLTTRTPDQAEAMGLRLGQDVTTKVDGKLMRITPLKVMDHSDAIVHKGIGAEEGTVPQPGDMLLKMEPYSPKTNVLSNNKNYLGLSKLADYEELFEKTLATLANQPRDFDHYIQLLRDAGNQFNPNLRALAERLDRSDTQTKNEFVSVVSLQYQPFSMVLLDSRKDSAGNSYNVLRTINANRGSQIGALVETWQQNQKFSPILKRNEAGLTVIDQEKAAELKADLSRVNSLFSGGKPEAQVAAIALMKKVFGMNGITMPDKAIDSLVNKTQQWTKRTSLSGEFRRQFSIAEDGRPLGIVSTLIQKLSGHVSENDDDDAMEDKSFQLSNPLYTEKNTINLLARVAAAFTSQLYSNTHRSSEGKSIYDYGFNNSLSRGIQRIKAEPAFRDKFKDVDIARKSWLLDHLNSDGALRDRFSISYLDGLKVAYMPSASGVVRPEMSDREQLLTSLGLFINGGDPKYAHYLSLTHSDKSTTPVFNNAPRLRDTTISKLVEDKISGAPRMVLSLSDEAISRLHDVFHSEYDRITRAAQVGDYNNPKYEEGARSFYFLPQFNFDRMKELAASGQLPQKVFERIWIGGKEQLNVKEAPGFKEAVQYVLTRHVDDMTNNALHEWKKNGIIEDGSTPIDRKYMNRLLTGIGMRYNRESKFYVDRAGQQYDERSVHNLTAQLAARDYAVNHYLMNVSASQLFYGDPAQVWKGSVDKTMVEYGKRLAKDIAPGRELAFRPGETYTSITARDFKTNAPYLAEVESLKKAYAEGRPLESTDAQELTTVKEHLDVLRAAGRLSDGDYKAMTKIIADAKGGYYEFTDHHHQQVILQPQKPVYVGDRTPNNGALLNDYIKSSSYPLYPPFLVGKELDKVRTAMEKGGVARLNFESAHKIGVPTSPVDLFDARGQVRDDVFDGDSWKTSARQDLSRDGFRIQQEVPYDEDKDSIRTVSQMNKLITGGIALVTRPFSFEGREVSAREMMTTREDIRKELFDLNRGELLPKIGAEIRDGKMVVTDRSKLFDTLRTRVLEGNPGFTANDIAYLQESNRLENSDELIIPLMYAPSASKFEAMMMSMVGDISNIRMPGHSYIQASPAGQQSVRDWESLPEQQKKQIVWVGDYKGEALKTVRPGATADAPLQPAELIAPWRFRSKLENYLIDGPDGRRVLDTSRVPEELLEAVGARIPNQGHNSMLPVRIVGFTPPNMGDLVIVPAAITKQMGSDFDVDKLYAYMRAYHEKPQILSDSRKPEHDNIRVDDRYQTMKVGKWEGKQEDAAARKVIESDIMDGNRVMGETGETFHNFEDRVLPAFRRILADAPDNTTIMTHSSVLKLMQQWDQEGRKDTNEVDPEAYNNRETHNGDVMPFRTSDGRTIWVVRHGQTEDNLANNFRSGDTNLTDKGIRQARESGQYLKEQTGGNIPELHTSHLPRTIHSSNLLMDEVKGNTNVKGPIFERSITNDDVLKNRYFDLHWSVLTHPDMLRSILNPLDKDDLKQEAALISGWENKRATIKPTYYDPIYQLRDFQSQKDAKRLVALASLSVTFNAVIQDKDLRPGRLGLGPDFQPAEEPVPVYLRDEAGKVRKLSTLSGYGQSHYTDGEGGKVGVQLRSKHDNHTTVQSEVVDYSKNKVSDKVHLSTYTYAASAALTQLQEPDAAGGKSTGKLLGEGRGWAAHLGYNARLLSQPIVQNFVSEMAKRGDSLSGEFNADLKNVVAGQIAEQYRAAAAAGGEHELADNHVVSYKDLTDALQSPDKQQDFNHKQIEALNLFMQLDQIGQSMLKAQSTINHDTNGAGSTMLDLISQENTRSRVENALGGKDGDVGLLGAGSLYERRDGQPTEQGRLYDMMHDAAEAVVGKEFPYRAMMPIFDYLMQHTNRQDLSIDTQKNVFNSVKSYLFSHPQLGFWADPEVTRANLLYRRNGNPSLADRVQDARTGWGQDNYFLSRLQVDVDPDNLHPSHVTYQASKASRLDDYENTKAWLDLFLSPHPESRKLAEDLVRYSYLTGGIQDTRSFVKYIPYSYLVGTDFGHKLRELTGNLDDLLANNGNFKEQWFQHNPQFAHSLTQKMTELGSEVEKYPERFSLQPINREDPYTENPAKDLIVRVKQEKGPSVPSYPDFLSYRSEKENRWILFKRLDRENYTRIDTLGDKNMDEFSVGEGLPRRSLIPENRSRAYDNIEPAFRMLNGSPMIERGEDIRERMHIPATGDYKDMMTILRRMTTEPDIPIHARVVADFLSKLPEHGANTEALRRFNTFSDFRFTNGDRTGFKGQFDAGKRLMEINDNSIRNSADLAETINHEMIHAHTSFLTLMSEEPEQLRRMGYPESHVVKLKLMWEDARKLPGVEDAINDVEEVRSRAEAKLRDFIGQKGINYDKRRKDVVGGKAYDDLDLLVYSMSSKSEFVTGALTNPTTMRWLNQQGYDGSRSFLSRMGDVVRNLMTGLARAFGYPADRHSLLEAAIGTSLNLMTVGKHSFDLTPERLHDVDNMQLVSNAPLTTATMAGLDRIIGKLHEQKDELVNSLTGRLPVAEVADKRAKIDDIETDISRLEKELSTDMVSTIGAKHLGWVDQVVKMENPSNSQIMTASRVLEVWTNLVDLLYGDTGAKVDPSFSELYSNAQSLRSNLTMKMKTTLVNTSDNIVGMKDFNSDNLKDIDRAQSLVRGLSSAATSRVSQYVATYMETVARHRDEDVVRNVNKMRDLEDRMSDIAGGKKNLPGFYSKFFQDNSDHSAWGLVQRFHQDWYDFRKDMRRKRDQAIKGADANPTNDAATSSREKQQAWQHYWKTMNDNAVFADTRLLFDANSGEKKDDVNSQRHTKELETQLGHDTAHELIDESQKRYQQYLGHKQAHFDSLDGEVAAGERPQEEADRLKDEFVSRYSPNVFFNNFKSPTANFKGINSDYYVRMAPRHVDDDHFYDRKFEDIQGDPRVKAIYDEINGTLQSLKDALPVHVQSELGHNFMPAIAKSLFTDMIDVPAYIKTMGDRMVNDLTASANEELEADKSYAKIPLRYINDDRKNLPLESRSKDIPRVLEAFGMMALHYKHFADAKDYIDMGESILKEIDRARTAGAAQMEQNGRFVTVKAGLRNTLDALKYMKDYLMYKKSRQLEGRTETMIYSANPVKQIRIAHDVKNLVKEREEIQRKFVDGEMDPAEAQEKVAAINTKISEYDGRRLYGSRIGDKLIGINQLKTLSYNPFSGVANLGFGIISAAIHANGAVDFGWRELGKATKLMSHSLLKWGSFGTKDSATAHKVLSIMDRLGIIGDVIDSHYGKIEVRERKPGWQRAINPYNLMRSGDYYMKGLTTVAMMLHDKIDVVEKGEAKKVSLWEAFDHEGNWDKARFGENKAWNSDDVTGQKEFDKFRNKAIRVNMIIHGNQDKNSPKLANKYILGRLIGQFRMSWLPEGWYSRFEGERYDIQLGRTIKGRYATIKDLGIMGYAAVTLRQMASIVAKVDPYTGTSRLDGKPLSDVDISNMRRNFAELGWIAGFAGTIVLLKSAIDPGDDDSIRWSLRLLANQLIRNQQDLEYYSSPSVIDSLTKSIIPASDVLKDYWKALKSTARVLSDSDYEADKWLLAITHAGIPIPQATLVNKVRTAATKDLDTLQ